MLGQNGGEIPFALKSSGLYTFTMPGSNVTVEASFAAVRTSVRKPSASGSISTVKRNTSNAEQAPVTVTTPTAPQFQPQATAPDFPFADISTDSVFYNAVRYVNERGIMTGTSATQFTPDAEISRAMIVSILHRLEGSPAAAGADFPDVAAGQWYTAAVKWASANAIVSGYSSGVFAPDDTITHEQLLSILHRYARYKNYNVSADGDLSGYADAASVQPYALDAMKWAGGRQLIASDGTALLAPNVGITRIQAADVLMRFCENVADDLQ